MVSAAAGCGQAERVTRQIAIVAPIESRPLHLFTRPGRTLGAILLPATTSPNQSGSDLNVRVFFLQDWVVCRQVDLARARQQPQFPKAEHDCGKRER